MSAGPVDANLATLFAAARAEHRPTSAQLAALDGALAPRLAVPADEATALRAGGSDESSSIKSRRGPLHRQLNPARLRIGGLWGAGLLVVGAAWMLSRSGPDAHQADVRDLTESAAVAPQNQTTQGEDVEAVSATALERAVAEISPLPAVKQPDIRARSATSRSDAKRAVAQPNGEHATAAGVPAAAASAAPIVHAQGDGPLLRDVAKLSRVEASLRSGNPRQALSLLEAAGVERLFDRATALRARASCQLGQREQGLRLLKQVPLHGEASSARARAVQACSAEK